MSASEHQHDPLPSADTHIRLLTILPRTASNPIPLALRTVSLSDATGKYDAVFYTWGNVLPVHEVLIDSKRSWIRENIWRFLRHCCSTKLGEKIHRELWIDSICINQKDTPEKNAQVQRMAMIFSHARNVIIWLGQASRQSLWADYGLGRYYRVADFMREVASYQDTLDDGDTALKTDIRRLMTSSYWTRLWVVQEVALAKQALVVLGTELCDLTIFRRVSNVARQFFQDGSLEGEDEVWRSAAKQVDQLAQRHLYRETQSVYRGLAPLVQSFAAQQCHDPHDHVYGLLGLLDSDPGLAIDYELDMELLFWQVLRVTHREVSAITSGSQRDSYQWNMESVLEVFGLGLQDVFVHHGLKHRIVDDRFPVELKNNGRVVPPTDRSLGWVDFDESTSIFSLIVSWYYYGDLSILVSSDRTYAKLAYISDPLNVAYAGDIFGKSVEFREMDLSDHIRQDLFASMEQQDLTEEKLQNNGEAGGSLSIGFSFRSLVELSRLSALGHDYLHPAKKARDGYVGGARQWANGFPWEEVIERAQAVLLSIPEGPIK